MSVRTRDWLKFGALVTMAFVFGLAFASALDLPTRGNAAESAAVLQGVNAPPPRAIPAAGPAADLSAAFTAVPRPRKPAAAFVESQPESRTDPPPPPPGVQGLFPISPPAPSRQNTRPG